MLVQKFKLKNADYFFKRFEYEKLLYSLSEKLVITIVDIWLGLRPSATSAARCRNVVRRNVVGEGLSSLCGVREIAACSKCPGNRKKITTLRLRTERV